MLHDHWQLIWTTMASLLGFTALFVATVTVGLYWMASDTTYLSRFLTTIFLALVGVCGCVGLAQANPDEPATLLYGFVVLAYMLLAMYVLKRMQREVRDQEE